MKKIFNDLLCMLYDDNEYKYMSLPRVVIWLLTMLIIIIVFAEVFWYKEFTHWTEMLAAYGSVWGAYGVKKFTHKNITISKEEEGSEPSIEQTVMGDNSSANNSNNSASRGFGSK